MKKIMMALAILGYTSVSAEAQTTTKTPQLKNPVAKSNNAIKVSSGKTCKVTYGQNYKVCKSKGGKYYACGTRPSTMTCTDPATNSHYTTTAPDNDAVIVEQPQAYNGNMPASSNTTSPYDKNYKVCKDHGVYHICGDENDEANAASAPQAAVRTTTVSSNGVITTTSTQTYPSQPAVAPVSQSYESEKTYTGNYPNQLPGVTVKSRADSINNANAPYHGKNSPQYDGLEKNKQRNLNTPPQSPNASFDGK